MALEIIRFWEIVRGDSYWLQRLIGNTHSVIDLAPVEKWFPHVREWPEVNEMLFGIAWFKGEYLRDFEVVDRRLADEGYGPDRRTQLPHLVRIVIPRHEGLRRLHEKRRGPGRVFVSDSKSVWRHTSGSLLLPYLDLERVEIDAIHVMNAITEYDGFLIACN